MQHRKPRLAALASWQILAIPAAPPPFADTIAQRRRAPFGMPPFATVLSNAEAADVLSYIRSAWGNAGAFVSALEASRFSANGRR